MTEYGASFPAHAVPTQPQSGRAADAYPNAAPNPSAMSWAAVLAGAAAAAALSLILLILGTGLGLSSVSPWSGQGATAATVGISTAVWLAFTQIAASGMGGYLAGRLRTRWIGTDPDEVYFRDTAHGFLSWAVATLATAALLGAAVSSVVGAGVQGAAGVASGAAGAVGTAATAGAAAAGSNMGDGKSGSAGNGSSVTSYFTDALMRRPAAAPAAAASDATGVAGGVAGGAASGAAGTTSSAPAAAADTGQGQAEAARILASAIADGNLPADDARYLAGMVAQRTGMSQADAEKRVTDTFTRLQGKLQAAEAAARDAANKARKAAAYSALWMFVSLLAGAFVASLAATFGGRRRDLY